MKKLVSMIADLLLKMYWDIPTNVKPASCYKCDKCKHELACKLEEELEK